MSKKSLLPLLLAGAELALFGRKERPSITTGRCQNRRAGEREQSRRAADEAMRRYLMYIIMPVWSVTGFLDWLWHRQTKIETTSGIKESMMHLLMMAEAGA
ncbi:MAG: hypothetical protein WB660_07230 [Candidatus Sulfotelmatobacter sp.]